MKFDWDPNKAVLNEQWHQVSFDEACVAFDDDHAVVLVDDAHSQREQRFNLIGAAGERLLFVVYTERKKGTVIRLISAREAEAEEREIYYAS
jgi:uncharacterized DUF497 family protein